MHAYIFKLWLLKYCIEILEFSPEMQHVELLMATEGDDYFAQPFAAKSGDDRRNAKGLYVVCVFGWA